MKWLTDLIETNSSSLEMLPIPCLCELFMIQCHSNGSRDPDDTTEQQAAHRMHYKRKKMNNEKVMQKCVIQSVVYIVAIVAATSSTITGPPEGTSYWE